MTAAANRRRQGRSADPRAAMLSIGALARATGIAIDTLRTWERRYGYPVPERKPSGHRVYPVASVPRLRRVADALARGHRAAEVVPASDEALSALVQASPTLPAAVSAAGPLDRGQDDASVAELLRTVAQFDGERLTRLLTSAWGRLGPLAFVSTVVGPFLSEVGDAWAAGRLAIRHEHFVSERVGDLLRAFRLPFEDHARGPLAVCGTLAGELHGLGLQMAALVLATLGWRTCYLGTDVPDEQIAQVAVNLGASVIAVSVAESMSRRRASAQLTRLRARVPRRVTLLVGGAGAPLDCPGSVVMTDLGALQAWASRAQAGG